MGEQGRSLKCLWEIVGVKSKGISRGGALYFPVQVPLRQQRAYSDEERRNEEIEGANGDSAAETGKVSRPLALFLCPWERASASLQASLPLEEELVEEGQTEPSLF